MSNVAQNSVRTMLLACMVLLGLQLWLPLTLHAADLPAAVDEVSLRPMDPDDPDRGLSLAVDPLLVMPGITVSVPSALGAPARPQHMDDEPGDLSLLAVAALQPSAP